MYTNGDETANRSHDLSVYDVPISTRKEICLDMPLLTEDEQRLLAKWNATQQGYPQDACVPQLVALQAATKPDAVALIAGDQVLTYKELNQRANQLARYLQMLGVRPNILVALCIERSLEMVVGLLGILKAGGAYVPLDPTYPSERLTFMLNDAQAPILITQEHLTAHLASHNAHVICLDGDALLLSQQSTIDPTSISTITDLAYIIYTSGSTGQPKGVQITHDSLLNLIFWHQRAFSLTSSDRATQLASPAFDATGWELWPYLTTGASVYLTDEDIRISPTLLRDWLVNHKITITFLPTALAESVMTLEWPSTTSLRFLLTGADTLYHYPPPTLPFALINDYGPTEATVLVTSGHVPPTEHTDMPPSIGRPIANTQIYILDEHLRQVPIGEPGELYIGGVGLAKGYLNRPELTTEKFIPHPFSNEPAARLYKTGDLARYLPDGQIAFLGRNDHQVKIRGFRVELGEIEAVLNQHPAVHQAVVVAREDTPGEKRLVGYVVLAPEVQVKASSLRETLMRHLPEYMVPSSFVLLEALPLTTNGKVDRAALPIPDATNTLRDEAITAPTSPIEDLLAGIIASLLSLEQVGIDDHFFLLGGHSLLATQVILQIAEVFGVELSLRSLFEAPTVRQLSAEVERHIFAKLDTMSEDEVRSLLH